MPALSTEEFLASFFPALPAEGSLRVDDLAADRRDRADDDEPREEKPD